MLSPPQSARTEYCHHRCTGKEDPLQNPTTNADYGQANNNNNKLASNQGKSKLIYSEGKQYITNNCK